MFGFDDAAIATLLSGVISTAGQLYTNKKNLQYQSNVNDTNWQIAAQNNATQIEMANTSHQREVADLQAAGLNPILSAGGSGAVTPSLQSARQDAVQIENPTEGLANSAKQLAHYVSESYKTDLEQKKEDVEYTKEDNKAIRRQNDVENTKAKNELMKANAENQALHELTYTKYRDKHGVFHDDFDPHSKYVQEIKSGLMSEAKDKANQNWRNNLQSINQSINSAGSVMHGIKSLRSPGKWRNILK